MTVKKGEFQQPYLYGEGKAALDTLMQAEVYVEFQEMQSQWKQPWKADSYPKMEYEWIGPLQQSYPQPPGNYMPSGDCTPKGDAIGGGLPSLCQPGISCGQWVFSCAHNITSFSVVQDFGWIQSVKYGPNDTVIVTVCWNETDRLAGRKVGPKGTLNNGKDISATIDLKKCEAPCKTCPGTPLLSIGYTSQQMSVNGTQALTASGGGGSYTWSMSGGGTLSKSSGASTTYTAPATNANCTYNPTLTVTDCCKNTATLKIAVNQYTTPADAYSHYFCANYCTGPCPPPNPTKYTYASVGKRQEYTCTGAAWGTAGTCGTCSFTCWSTVCYSSFSPSCTGDSETVCNTAMSQNCPGKTQDTYYDDRTDAMKTGGCCPAKLLS